MYELGHIREKIKSEYECLILFGSYSRKDQKENSDIDILQVSEINIRSYSFENYNVSVYTPDRLFKMASEGNLFVLHIIREGKVIGGNVDFLDNLKTHFKIQKNYDALRKDILITAKLLDVKNEEEYNLNWSGFNNLLCFLFRTYLYSVLYDTGHLYYSISQVSKELEDKRVLQAFELKKNKQANYIAFQEARNLFESYSNDVFINEYNSAADLINNIKHKSQFLIEVAIHFIQSLTGSIEY